MNAGLYETLGIPPDATEKEIKAAYRKKSKQQHPDRNPDDKTAKEKFQKTAAAYRILGTPKTRKKYDATGETGTPENALPELMDFVKAHMETFVAQMDETEHSPTDLCLSSIEITTAEAAETIKTAKLRIKKINAIRKRIKGPKFNPFLLSLDEMLHAATANMHHARQVIALNARLKKGIANFTYRTGEDPIGDRNHHHPLN